MNCYKDSQDYNNMLYDIFKMIGLYSVNNRLPLRNVLLAVFQDIVDFEKEFNEVCETMNRQKRGDMN